MKSKEVEQLQSGLKLLGFVVSVDGDYGPKTKAAVVAFQQAYLVDGIADDTTQKAVTHAVQAWTKMESGLMLPIPIGYKALEEQFGAIVYDEAGGGQVHIVNDWADENIIKANLPVVGDQLIHKKMEQVFKNVFQLIKDRGLDEEILQFGCWCPRHKMHNPKNGLSTHSWAIACDINWATNMPGKVGDLNPAIVEVFEACGFEWGGRWRTRDDMHFQYAKQY